MRKERNESRGEIRGKYQREYKSGGLEVRIGGLG